MRRGSASNTLTPVLRITALYAVFGLAWIAVGGWLSAQLLRGVENVRFAELLKGCVFVLLTSVLLFALLRRELVSRARLHAELEDERARFVEAQAVAKVGSWDTDVLTLEVRWSEETHRIFGTDPATFRPTHAAFLERVHPDDRARVDEAFRASLRGGGAQAVEHRVVCVGGSVKSVEERWRVFHDEQGRAVRALGICRDVTAQREAERALRESQQMISSVIHAIPVRVFWKDLGLRYLGCNAAFARDAGCAGPEEVVGKDDFQLAWRDLAERYRADDREVIATGRSRMLIEEPLTTPGGRILSLLTSKTPLRDTSGAIIGVLGTYMDVTERRRAEVEQIKLATAVEQAAEAVVITDERGVIEYVNPAFERATGYTLAETRGQNPRLLKSGRHDASFYRAMWETLVAGGVWSGRMTNRRKDGTLLEEEATISPVRDATGRITNFVAVKHDVTRQVQLQQQLLQAQKMEAVGRLAGGVAHDFNNLLTVINGYSELALTRLAEGDPLREWITDIGHAGVRAKDLTRQLLAFSRRQVLRPELLDLNAVVRGLEAMLRRLIGEDVQLTTRLLPIPGAVRADPGQLEQVLLNLCVNARDAMPKGGSLRIETSSLVVDPGATLAEPSLRPGPYALLSVTDTGHGMDEATLAHLFEPFFTTKATGRGTGLGLATVHGIVRQSGGSVRARSEPGRGSTFDVLLPQVEAEPAPRPPPEATEALPSGTETVLLVEDEPAVRGLASHVLRSCGYEVLEAGDGEQALRLAAEHPGALHLLISDVVMPRLGGRELSERVRALRPDCRVLFVSGYTDDAILRHGVQSDGAAFLAKPFSPRALSQRVREVLGAPTAGRPSGAGDGPGAADSPARPG